MVLFTDMLWLHFSCTWKDGQVLILPYFIFPSNYAVVLTSPVAQTVTNSLRCRPRFDPWVGKIPWRREGLPLQYSCLGNPMDRGAWRATVHGVTKNQTRLSDRALAHSYSCTAVAPAWDYLVMDLSQKSSLQSTNIIFSPIPPFPRSWLPDWDGWDQAVNHPSLLHPVSQWSSFPASLFSTLNNTTLNCPRSIIQIWCWNFFCWHLLY